MMIKNFGHFAIYQILKSTSTKNLSKNWPKKLSLLVYHNYQFLCTLIVFSNVFYAMLVFICAMLMFLQAMVVLFNTMLVFLNAMLMNLTLC